MCPMDHFLIDQVVRLIDGSSVIRLVLGKMSYDADARVSLLALCAPVSAVRLLPCAGIWSLPESYFLYQGF